MVSLFLAGKVKYEQKMPVQKPFDVLGSVLLFLAVTLITVGIMQAGDAGLTSPSVLLFVGAGLVVGVILVVTSLRKENPLMQFRLFQIGTVAIALFIVFMRFLPNILMGAFVARFVQQALGLSPTVTGLLMILPVLAQVVAAPVAGKMLDQVGPRKPVALGVGLLAAGASRAGVWLTTSQNLWLVLLATILGGAGFSFTNPVQMAALSATPLEQRGMLAGVLPLAGNFGTALFVALLTAGMGAFMNSLHGEQPGCDRGGGAFQCIGHAGMDQPGSDPGNLVRGFQAAQGGRRQASSRCRLTSHRRLNGEHTMSITNANNELPRIEDYRADLAPGEIRAAAVANTRSIAMQAYLHAFPAFLHMRQLTEFIQGRRYMAPGENPLGGWFLMRKLADTNTTTVSPNVDTLYGATYLFLDQQGPMVLSVPAISDRYYSVALLDAYFNNFAIISPRTYAEGHGEYLVVPPGWQGEAPARHQGSPPVAHADYQPVPTDLYAQRGRVPGFCTRCKTPSG